MKKKLLILYFIAVVIAIITNIHKLGIFEIILACINIVLAIITLKKLISLSNVEDYKPNIAFKAMFFGTILNMLSTLNNAFLGRNVAYCIFNIATFYFILFLVGCVQSYKKCQVELLSKDENSKRDNK